jgi:hypothetical protein
VVTVGCLYAPASVDDVTVGVVGVCAVEEDGASSWDGLVEAGIDFGRIVLGGEPRARQRGGSEENCNRRGLPIHR